MGQAIWENPIEIRLGESFQFGNVYSYTVKKGYSSLLYVDDIKLAGMKQI